MGYRTKTYLKKMMGWLVVSALIIWPCYQIVQSLGESTEKADASKLLYQVAQFQMELLNSALSESTRATSSEELNALLLAVYSANYTHERLDLAEGKSLTNLSSLEEMIQYLLRLQISGDRPLKQDERDTFAQAEPLYKGIFENYSK